MGEGNHTPGPWRIDEPNDWGIEIVGRPTWGCERNGVKGEWDVAKLERLDCDEETMANARLIAAAPDLLEALQVFVHGFELDQNFFGAEMEKARAAIAKAGGYHD